MIGKFRLWVGAWLFKPELDGILTLQKETQQIIDRRVAEIMFQMDPYEPLMRKFKGTFSSMYAHPEDNLSDPSKMRMLMLGYQLDDDPSFKFLVDWIMNTHGNQVLRQEKVTRENALDVLLYGKSAISNMILLKREVGRLSSLYKEIIGKNEPSIISDSVAGE